MNEELDKILVIEIPYSSPNEEAETIFIDYIIKGIGVDCQYTIKERVSE